MHSAQSARTLAEWAKRRNDQLQADLPIGFAETTSPLVADERYVGVEMADAPGRTDVERTRRLFTLLSAKMGRTRFPFADSFGPLNPFIPAGYTYLAQLVAHDLSINSGLDEGLGLETRHINLRSYPLHLDCVYGYGPSIEPACYEIATKRPIAQRIGWPKTRFRLDGIADDKFAAPADSSQSPRRDIGRLVEKRGNRTVGVALIADARNDDNAVISQLTALFQLAHNIAMEVLEQGSEPATPEESFRHFTAARMAITMVYRQIVRHDLLPRLLSPAVLEHYETAPPAARYFDRLAKDNLVTSEFAHAAYRVGHAMIRESYAFSGEPPIEHSLTDVLRRNSERNPPKTPHNRDWIIAWSNFFDLDIREARPSGRLEPRYETPLLDGAMFPSIESGTPAGLAYRDLVRCATMELRKIDTLCEQIAAWRPEISAASAWLNDRDLRQGAVRRWIEADTKIDLGDLKEETIGNPPPMLYFLVEAAAAENGFRLGPLGSVVLAETFYRALDYNRASSAEGITPNQAVKAIFGGNVPRTMPELIHWVDQRMAEEDKMHFSTAIPLI